MKIDAISDSFSKHTLFEEESVNSNSIPSCYTRPDTIDAWRHKRMHDLIKPFIDVCSGTTWLTIGDGGYGSDSFLLKGNGVKDVTASSISDSSLTVAKEKNYIDKYLKVNAEKIDLDNNSFDYVFCKEAYHHFPRPPVGFYEMLRVSKKAVILIEPQESNPKLFDILKDLFKKNIRRDSTTEYEPVGNFIFRLNIAEIIKMAKALNLKHVAYKRFNDFYFRSFSSKKSEKGLPMFATKFGIFIQNVLCKLRLMNFGLASLIIFKDSISDEELNNLRNNKFKVINLPRNPYI